MYKKLYKTKVESKVVENFVIDRDYEDLYISYDVYTKSLKNIVNFLNNLGLEWWPVEGTLIGMLRMGNVFGNLGKKLVISDSDIDLFIRFDKDQDWIKFKKDVNNFLVKQKNFIKCVNSNSELVTFNNKSNKLSCHTGKYITDSCKISDGDIHIDFHRYIVNEKENLVYMNEMCKDGISCNEKYPFQKWNGYVNYKGFIVDENKNFLKTKFLDIDINCPYKYIELLSNWNNNEYGNGSDIHLPRGNCIYDKQLEEITNNNTFTEKELKMICEKSKFLHNNGYASFFSKWNFNCS